MRYMTDSRGLTGPELNGAVVDMAEMERASLDAQETTWVLLQNRRASLQE